jgi:hypothetical protein
VLFRANAKGKGWSGIGLRIKAVVMVSRKNDVFHTGEAVIYRTYLSYRRFEVVKQPNLPWSTTALYSRNALIFYGYYSFSGFPVSHVPAFYRKGENVDGYGVALILEPSQIDLDFGYPTLFLSEEEVNVVREAFKKSDELTHNLLGRGWTGKRPFIKVEDFM